MKLLIGWLLTLQLGSIVPFWKRPLVKLQVHYGKYACQPCPLGYAYNVEKIVAGKPFLRGKNFLVGKPVALYYQGGYFAEKAHFKKASDFDRPLIVTCRLRRRNPLTAIFQGPFRADVLSYELARK